MKKFSVIFLALFISACSVSVPPVTEYGLKIDTKQTKILKKKCLKSLKVQQGFAPDDLTTTKMYYAQEKYKLYTYSQSAWVEAPNRSISDALVEKIRNYGVFSSVSSYRSRAASDLILEINIDDFKQYFNANETKSFAKLSITLNLLDRKKSQIIASKTIVKELKVKTLDAQGGVRALNTLLNQFLDESVVWLEKVCNDK